MPQSQDHIPWQTAKRKTQNHTKVTKKKLTSLYYYCFYSSLPWEAQDSRSILFSRLGVTLTLASSISAAILTGSICPVSLICCEATLLAHTFHPTHRLSPPNRGSQIMLHALSRPCILSQHGQCLFFHPVLHLPLKGLA